MLLGSMFHDIGHPGVNNHFLIARGDALAVRYNDTSVLESMHCATGFELMKASGVDLFRKMGSDFGRKVRRHIIAIIMATDMAFHQAGIKEVDELISAGTRWEDGDMQVGMAKALVHSSDIGNP